MRSRTVVHALLAVAAAAATGCSKTEDVAADKKVFGETPRVESFEAMSSDEMMECDVTKIMINRACDTFEFPGVKETAPIVLRGPYTSVQVLAKVVDPDSTPDRSDLLLVAASYVLPDSTVEESLVMFDDGGANVFVVHQKNQLAGGKNCTSDEAAGTCSCTLAGYPVHSNDSKARDDIFTRAVAVIDSGTPQDLQDCILAEKHQALLILKAGSTITFQLDAFDQRGNLDTFGIRPSVPIGDFSNLTLEQRLVCTGDECGCCIFQNPSDYNSKCGGKPGLLGPPGTSYENGICLLLPPPR